MNAHTQRELLSAFMDGELNPAETAGVKAHVESCADCKSELHELHALKSSLQSLPAREMPAELRVEIRQEAETKLVPAWKKWALAPRIFIPATGFALALLSAGLWIWQNSPNGDDAIPVESLIAAHHRYLEEGSLPPADLSSGAFSARLASFHEEAE